MKTAGSVLCLALLLLIGQVPVGAPSAAGGQDPVIHVRPVKGAPSAWDMSARVARALRSYRFQSEPASPNVRGYVLKGRVRPKLEGGEDLLLSWDLAAPNGEQIGDFIQLTSVPYSGEAEKDALDVLANAMAATVAWRVAERSSAKPATVAQMKGGATGAKAEPPMRKTSIPARAPAATGLTVYWVQVGAFADQPQAERWYGALQDQHAAILKSAPYVIIPADLGGTRGVWYRVRVGPFPSAAAAGGMCRRLKSEAVDCFIRKTG